MTLGGRTFSTRFDVVGHARFVTFSCVGRSPLFSDKMSRDAFAARLDSTAERLDVAIFAWVLMPEHAHLVLGVHAVGEVRTFLERLKSSTARDLLKIWRQNNDPRLQMCTRNARAVFWQPGGGYERTLRDEHEIDEKIDYIHANP